MHFWAPFGGLHPTYNDHLRLIGKRIVDFLLVSIELFLLGVMAEVLRVIICSKSAISLQRGQVYSKFQIEGIAPYQPFLFSEKWSKWSFAWYKNLDIFLSLSQCTRLTDRRTDRILITRLHLHSMQCSKNAFSNLCPHWPITGDTLEKFYTRAQLHSFCYTKA